MNTLGKYATALGLLIVGGIGTGYVMDRSDIDKQLKTKPPIYRSLTNGSMIIRPIETEREVKGIDMLVAGCADRIGIKKSKVYKMMDNANLEMFGEPLDLANIKVGDKIPFPCECE